MPRLAVGADHRRRRETAVGVVEVIKGESDLLEMVARCRSAGRGTGLGNRVEVVEAVAFRLGLGDEEIGEAADRFRGGGVGGPLTEQARERTAEDGWALLNGGDRVGAERCHGNIAFEDLFDVDTNKRVERPARLRWHDEHGLPLSGNREHRPLGTLDPRLALRRIDRDDPVRRFGKDQRIAHDNPLFRVRRAGERHSEQETVTYGERRTHGKSPGGRANDPHSVCHNARWPPRDVIRASRSFPDGLPLALGHSPQTKISETPLRAAPRCVKTTRICRAVTALKRASLRALPSGCSGAWTSFSTGCHTPSTKTST